MYWEKVHLWLCDVATWQVKTISYLCKLNCWNRPSFCSLLFFSVDVVNFSPCSGVSLGCACYDEVKEKKVLSKWSAVIKLTNLSTSSNSMCRFPLLIKSWTYDPMESGTTGGVDVRLSIGLLPEQTALIARIHRLDSSLALFSLSLPKRAAKMM